MNITITPTRISGQLCAPPSKSLAHRAVICASLAGGTSEITNLALSEDIEASIGAMRQFGAKIALSDAGGGLFRAKITGGKPRRDLRIDCGESGSTLRFLLPLSLAAANGATFEGRGRLGMRPLDVYQDIFLSQGISWHAAEGGLPLTVGGRLFPGKYMVPGDVSSQFISGLLLALPLLGGSSTLKVIGRLESHPYVDLTLDTLKKHGIKFKQASGPLFSMSGMQQYKPCSHAIEGDWSQAAFLIALGALGGGIKIMGLNPESAQGDRMILSIVNRMGGNYVWQDGILAIERAELYGARIDLSDCPDLAPPIAAMCAAAQGESVLTGIGRLRLKESDRVESIAACIKAAGGKVQVNENSMEIAGGRLSGGSMDSYGDHRIAMMAAALSPACGGSLHVTGAESVNKSWPGFWDSFARLGGKIH